MADPARVLEEALELEPTDGAGAAHALIASLEEPEPDAEALWGEEIRTRLDEIEVGTAELEEWDMVRQQPRSPA